MDSKTQEPELRADIAPRTNVEKLSNRAGAKPVSSPRDIEVEALEKAGVLLRFAAEAKEMPKATIHSICAAWSAQERGEWTLTVSQDFWKGFNQLCDLIKPASLESLTVTNELVSYRPFWRFWDRTERLFSPPKRTAQRYLSLMLLILCVSVLLQFVVSTATGLRTEIEKLLASSEALVQSAAQKVPTLQAVNVSDFNDPKIPDNVKHLVEIARREMSEVYSNFDKVTFKTEAFSRLTYSAAGEPPLHRNAIFIDPNLTELQKGINAYFRLRQRAVLRLENGNLIIGIISASILPILLGAMGACAYVTRLIAQQVREMTYSRTSPTQHVVRVALGALAGVIVGYGGIAQGISVSPSALAFIAGYAVEPVFATLDKIADKIRRAA